MLLQCNKRPKEALHMKYGAKGVRPGPLTLYRLSTNTSVPRAPKISFPAACRDVLDRGRARQAIFFHGKESGGKAFGQERQPLELAGTVADETQGKFAVMLLTRK
jgi:hypothetical protein